MAGGGMLHRLRGMGAPDSDQANVNSVNIRSHTVENNRVADVQLPPGRQRRFEHESRSVGVEDFDELEVLNHPLNQHPTERSQQKVQQQSCNSDASAVVFCPIDADQY